MHDCFRDSLHKGLRINARIQHIYYFNFFICNGFIDPVYKPVVLVNQDTAVVMTAHTVKLPAASISPLPSEYPPCLLCRLLCREDISIKNLLFRN